MLNIESKGKIRGKPFKKGNIKGKIFKDSEKKEKIIENQDEDEGILFSIPQKTMSCLDSIIKDSLSSKEKNKDLELIDKIDFKNGENTLTIRFSKKNNRMYRIQVFLNDKIEVRPVTYTGSSTGNTFWEVLKGGLKE